VLKVWFLSGEPIVNGHLDEPRSQEYFGLIVGSTLRLVGPKYGTCTVCKAYFGRLDFWMRSMYEQSSAYNLKTCDSVNTCLLAFVYFLL